LHWLPPSVYRAILRGTKLKFFADEANLNLVERCRPASALSGAGHRWRSRGWRATARLDIEPVALR
jgi:hypothetical protein